MQKPSISIIIPCLNEAGNLNGAIKSVKTALKESGRFDDFEILIFNDGSTDATGQIADSLSKEDSRIKAIHNERNMGFGYNYTKGVSLASKEYIIMVPGDNEIPSEAIKKTFSKTGLADIVVPYTANTWVRPMSRRIISRVFVFLINTLFGLNLTYYNGTCIIKSDLMKKVPLKTWGFAYMAAILVRLIKSGASYTEVGVDIQPRDAGATKAFKLKNIVSVGTAIVTLFWDVQIADRGSYRSAERRIRIAA